MGSVVFGHGVGARGAALLALWCAVLAGCVVVCFGARETVVLVRSFGRVCLGCGEHGERKRCGCFIRTSAGPTPKILAYPPPH